MGSLNLHIWSNFQQQAWPAAWQQIKSCGKRRERARCGRALFVFNLLPPPNPAWGKGERPLPSKAWSGPDGKIRELCTKKRKGGKYKKKNVWKDNIYWQCKSKLKNILISGALEVHRRFLAETKCIELCTNWFVKLSKIHICNQVLWICWVDRCNMTYLHARHIT